MVVYKKDTMLIKDIPILIGRRGSIMKKAISVLCIFLGLIICLPPCFAYAESEVGTDAPEIADGIDKDLMQPEEEEIIEEQAAFCSETVSIPDATDNNDVLFQKYFENLLMPKLRRPVGPSNLSDVDLSVYWILKYKACTVAELGGSTKFEAYFSDIGITKLSWTKEELGGIKLTEGGKITEEAKAAVFERLGINLSLVVRALTQDCPYEMYWFDKTAGVTPSCSMRVVKNEDNTYSISIYSETITYPFSVSVNYGEDYIVDSAGVYRAHQAAQNARAIVRTYAAFPDHEKLTAYKDEICALTAYNYAAVSSDYPYGDPWQVIYVFDGDPETKVVCEGYAKAFEYLCDMSGFLSPGVSCISVTGEISSGKHMWNIVTLDGGINVLVDVTNCDTGSSGADSQPFLVGYSEGNVSDGYDFSYGSTTNTWYVYDDKTKALFTEEELTLIPASGACGDNLTWSFSFADGVLTISGTGTMAEYGALNSPWYSFGYAISNVIIGEGVTSIGEAAFSGCSSLSDLYYNGTLDEWNAVTKGPGNEALALATIHCLYTVTISDEISNGTVEVDQIKARENETVILTVTPNTGYDLSSLNVKQGEMDLAVENNQFTMPAGNVTVTADFKPLTYEITWLNDDDSVIDTTTVEYGTVPAHADAAKAATAEYAYTFAGWTPELTAVTGNATYKAAFTAVPPFGTPTFTFPAEIKHIEESAFEGVKSMTVVEIPNGCISIGKGAFKDCSDLTQIRIPASVTAIDSTAFEGVNEFTIFGTAGSKAETYAKTHNIIFVAEP